MAEKSTGHMLEREKELHLHHARRCYWKSLKDAKGKA
jgi:hypothetical protein